MDYKYLIQLGITVAGWCVMIGVYTQKIKQHEKELDNINHRIDLQESAFDVIKDKLGSLDTKMDLLLSGKINISNQTGDGK